MDVKQNDLAYKAYSAPLPIQHHSSSAEIRSKTIAGKLEAQQRPFFMLKKDFVLPTHPVSPHGKVGSTRL